MVFRDICQSLLTRSSVRRNLLPVFVGCGLMALSCYPNEGLAEPAHGIAMHGQPKYSKDFKYLDYVNPDAPKGGQITYAGQGSFDSLNPFILKGVAPRGLWDVEYGHNVYEPLLERTSDEAFSLYGLIAEWVDLPEDRSSITFKIRDEARFSDGEPVTVEDVKFTVELLREYGRPSYPESPDQEGHRH